MTLLHHRGGPELAIRWAEDHFQEHVISWLSINVPLKKPPFRG